MTLNSSLTLNQSLASVWSPEVNLRRHFLVTIHLFFFYFLFDNTIFLLLDGWILVCRTHKEDCLSNGDVEGQVNDWLSLVGKVLNGASWR